MSSRSINLKSLLKSQTIRDSLISFVGLGVTAVIGFVYTAILARHLGPATFGVYSSVAALATIFYTVGDLGISSAIINFLPKHPSDKKRIIGTGLLSQTIIAAFVFLLFYGFSLIHKILIPNSLPEYLVLAGILTVNYLLIGFAQSVFTAEKRYWTFTVSQVIDAGLKIILVLFFWKISKLNISFAIFANILSTLAALLVTFSKELTIKSFNSQIFSKLFHYSKWIGLSRFFSVWVSRVDVIILNLLVSGYVAGIFSAASRVTLLFALVISSLNSVVNSRYSQFDTNAKVIKYSQKLLLFIAGIALLMIFSSLFAPLIIEIAFGSKFSAAVPVFRALVVAMIPYLFGLITTPALLYTFHQTKFYAFVTIFQVVTMISLELLLIGRFQVFAPAIALGITNTFALLFSSIRLVQCLKNGIKK